MVQLKVAIIGAGPAGCLLARLLHLSGVAVVVFEAETSPTVRTQGGTLDLHPKTGITAIKAAGLYDAFIKKARKDSACLQICDKKGHIYFHLPAFLSGNPEIDRVQLRSLLLESIPSEMIRWGHRLEKVTNRAELHFTNGVVESDFDLLVGADGAWSKVRLLLTDEKPAYSGIAGYDLSVSDQCRRGLAVNKMVNNGSLFAFSDGKSIIGQQMADGSIHVSAWCRHDEDWIQTRRQQPIPLQDIDAELGDWADNLLDLVRHADGEVRVNAFYALPSGFQWTHRPLVTLTGDAAHLMTPFAGEGVNIALDDAMKLAQAIIKSSQDRDPQQSLLRNVAAYESAMFKRARRAQKMTESMLKAMYFTEGAPRTSIASWVVARASYDAPPAVRVLLRPLLVVGVNIFYFAFKLLTGR